MRTRVLQIIGRLNLGGAAQPASLLSGRRFDPERFETLLVHGSLAAGEESMAGFAEREGARTLFLPSLSRSTIPSARDAQAVAQLARIARRFAPHIVHTHTAKAGFLGRTAALTMNPRPEIVHTYHGHVLEHYFGPLQSAAYTRLERALGRVSDRLIGVSQSTVDDLVRLGVAPRSKFLPLPLGVDLDPFTSADPISGRSFRERLGIGDEVVLLSFVGRVVPIKRLDLLIRAFAAAKSDLASLRLAIVGDGEIRLGLERLASRLGVREGVYFLGYRREGLPAIARAADVAVLSSDAEGTPVSLIEAAAAGRPAVATAVGGVPEVVTRDSGMLVPADDEASLANALVRLARDDAMRARMGEAARDHVVPRYSASCMLDKTEILYRELLTPDAVDHSSKPGAALQTCTGPGRKGRREAVRQEQSR